MVRLIISQFDFDIEYLPGPSNFVADALSRPPAVEEIEVNETVTQVVVNVELKKEIIEGYLHIETFSEVYDILSSELLVPNRLNVTINQSLLAVW